MDMLAHTYIPAPPLSDFMTSFYYYESSAVAHARERLLPTATTELVINLRGDALRLFDRQTLLLRQSITGSMICGPHSEVFVIDAAQKSAVVTVHFKPGGAYPFFGLPAHELHNMCIPLEAVWGRLAYEMCERMGEAATPLEKFQVLEHYLAQRLWQALHVHPAVRFALTHFVGAPHGQAIAAVADRIGLSSRQFIQVFRQEVGMTPKLFCRVLRFQEVVHALKAEREPDWLEVAYACGYYDQAHFIHDFRAFSGLTPTAYIGQRGAQLNHIPIER